MSAWDDSLPQRAAAFGGWQAPQPPGLGTQLHVIGTAISRSSFGQRLVVGFFSLTTLALVAACAWLLAQRNSSPAAPAVTVEQVGAPSTASHAPTAAAPASDEQWLSAARTKLAKKRAALLKAEERYQKLRAAKGSPKQLAVAAKKVKFAQAALNKQLDSVLGPELKNATASAR